MEPDPVYLEERDAPGTKKARRKTEGQRLALLALLAWVLQSSPLFVARWLGETVFDYPHLLAVLAVVVAIVVLNWFVIEADIPRKIGLHPSRFQYVAVWLHTAVGAYVFYLCGRIGTLYAFSAGTMILVYVANIAGFRGTLATAAFTVALYNAVCYLDHDSFHVHVAPFRSTLPFSMLYLGASVLFSVLNHLFEVQRQTIRKLFGETRDQAEALQENKIVLEATVEKLKELDQLKSRFFANISHELRTPLTMSLAPLESILQGEKGEVSPKTRPYLETVRRNSLRLLKLINDLLDFSKVEAGKMKLKVAEEDIVKHAQVLLSSIDSWAERQRLAVEFAADAGVPRLWYDTDKIEKVILNLLSNAIKFGQAGGKISVRVSQADGHVRVAVRDTGIGIPQDKLDKVFERFTQVDASASRQYEGTGIGLALAKELVELHKGRIWAESELGKGSTFAFDLPVGKDHFDQGLLDQSEEGRQGGPGVYPIPRYGATEPVASGFTPDGSTPDVKSGATEFPDRPQSRRREEDWEGMKPEEGVKDRIALRLSDLSPVAGADRSEITVRSKEGAPKVLVVEDHADLRAYVADLLSDEYEVHMAADGEEGVSRAKQIAPALVISDVMMPKKDGYALLRELRTDPETRHIPIILLTARADVTMKVEGLEQGADDYLTKPFNSRELLARAANLVRLKEMEAELALYGRSLEQKVKEQVAEIGRKSRLERYLAPQVVETILKTGDTQMAEASRKKLTVMFTDIRGFFTEFSDSLEPEETTAILNEYLSEMTKIVFEHGGTIDKFLGDAIMVFFGDPIPQDDHALRAVRCAMAMNRRVKELEKKWFPTGGRELKMGIGINTGYVTVGNIGSTDRMEYTVIGNQVNLAARLQALAGPGEIIMSASTYGLVKHEVKAEEKGQHEIKGFVRPVQVWRVC